MPRAQGKPNTPPVLVRAKGLKTIKSGTKSNDSGGREPSNITMAPAGAVEFRCLCGRGYASKATLSRHQKECGKRDQTKCQFCGKAFPTFAGVRQHERRAHPVEYQQQLQDQLPAPESEIMEKIALIEAKSTTGVFYTRMMSETGLTRQQIRYRRERAEYQLYLEKARKQLARGSTSSPATAATPQSRVLRSKIRPPKPSSPRAIRVAPRVLRSKPPPRCTPQTSSDSSEPSLSGPSTLSDISFSSAGLTDGSDERSIAGPRVFVRKLPDSSDSSSDEELMLNPDTPVNTFPSDSAMNIGGGDPIAGRESTNISAASPPTPTPVTRTPLVVTAPQLRPQLRRRSRSLSAIERPTSSSGTFLQEISAYLRGLAEVSPPSDYEDIEALVEGGINMPDGDFLHFIDRWLSVKFNIPRTRGGRNHRRGGRGRHYGQTTTGATARAANFKKHQDLYERNRKGLAEAVIAGRGVNAPTVYPTVKSVEELYGGILSSESPVDEEEFVRKHLTPGIGDLPILTVGDVQEAKRGWARSSCGTDGVRVEVVSGFSDHVLAALFNIILHRNIHPTAWRSLRTTLVPKGGDLKNPANWRPITIGSAVQRLFHRVLVARLQRMVELSLHQRGFVAVDGTLGNMMVLHEYIRHRTDCRKPYNVVSLDVKKAFDTVSHHSIRRALNRFGIPRVISEYVMTTFDASTIIRVGDSYTGDVTIRRGVRQGDPLSPLLFNMVMDELLERVTEKYTGATLPNGERCAIMAFADDLLLLSDREVDLPLMLQDATCFLRRRGMSLNPAKCRVLSCGVVSGRPIARSRLRLELEGIRVPTVDAADAFKYLGHDYGHSGIEKPSILNLSVWLSNISAAPLKPDQKLSLIRQFVIPKLLYGLQNPRVDRKTLREADRLVKKTVKKALHLNAHTPDALLHASVRDGGLGIMELSRAVPRIFLGRLSRLLERDDLVLSAVLQSTSVRQMMSKLSDMAGDVPEATYWRERVASGPLSRGQQQAAEDSASRLWLINKPTGWSGRDFVRAVQLRTANLPTKAIPSNPVGERRCRGGCACDENISHVLQTCPVTHWERIRRHNEIVAKVARHCRKRGWTVEEEPHIRSRCGQLFKPDLAVHQPGDKVVIADVQVAWDSDNLCVPYERKRRKYDVAPFNAAAQKRWPGKTVTFAPVIVGARGIWPRVNNDSSADLQMPASLRQSCVHSALKWASTIHTAFMKAVWRTSRGPVAASFGG